MNFVYFPNLFEASLFNDAELKFSNGSMKVSRMILAGHSKYFYDLFTKDTTQTSFGIENFNLVDFKIYYEYIHVSSDFKIDADKIVSLLNVQSVLNLPDMKAKLNEWINRNEFIIYQGILFENTNKNSLKEFNELSEKLISLNFKALVEIKAFDSFSRDSFLRLMNKDFIDDKEQSVILDIITRWVEYDFNTRKMDWLDLLSRINYDKIDATLLSEYIENNINIFVIPQLIQFLYSKIMHKANFQRAITSVIPQGGYSKLILFGGNNAQQSVVNIDTINNTVREIGNLRTNKSRHSSEKIGDNVFVLGSSNNKKIEKYNLQANTSEILSFEMSSDKYNYSSVIHGNRIYLIGGSLSIFNYIDTVEYFEPEKMTWISAPKLLQKTRCHDSVIVDDMIYAVGDYGTNKLQRFDPRQGVWSFLMGIPTETYYSAVTSFDQTITCVGGDGDEGKQLCQVYDIRNNKWRKLEDLPLPVYGAKSLENEKSIIVVGGQSDSIQKYNKKEKAWIVLDIKLPTSNYWNSKILL